MLLVATEHALILLLLSDVIDVLLLSVVHLLNLLLTWSDCLVRTLELFAEKAAIGRLHKRKHLCIIETICRILLLAM